MCRFSAVNVICLCVIVNVAEGLKGSTNVLTPRQIRSAPSGNDVGSGSDTFMTYVLHRKDAFSLWRTERNEKRRSVLSIHVNCAIKLTN